MNLTADMPFSDPVVATNAVYVLGLKRKIPSENPPLETIQARVTEDYRQSRALELARQAGRAFHQSLTNGLAQGKTFEAICAEANVSPVTLPAFSQSTRFLPELENRVSLVAIKNVTTDLGPGQATRFSEARDGGFVALVTARTPVAEAKVKSELPAFMEELREERQYLAFNEWFRRERDAAGMRFAADTDTPRQ
jgi:hypothetical protein